LSKFYTSVNTLGNKVLVRGIDQDRPETAQDFIRREEFKPTMFVSGKKTKEKTPFKTLDGTPVYKIKPGDIRETRDFCKQYEDIEGFKVYGIDDFGLQYTVKTWKNEVDYDINRIRVWNIDIEVETHNGFPTPSRADQIINAITYYDSLTKLYYTYALNGWENTRDDVVFREFATERDMLIKFLDDWQRNPPHIITGWNIEGFDIPYIMNRYARLFGVDECKKFSPFNYIRTRNAKSKFGKEVELFTIYGVAILDYLQLYQKFTYSNQESYKLDHIAHVELGERKISYAEEGTLLQLAQDNHQKFIDYNIKDVELVKRIDDKLKLIDLAVTMAYDAKINYEDVMGTVKMWDAIIYDYLHGKNIVAPPKSRTSKNEKFEGAYVKEPITGFHDWVVSFDLNSLYPHLIMHYNISPETVANRTSDEFVGVDKCLSQELDLDYLKDENLSMAPNGVHYTKEKRGFLPDLMEKVYNERTIYKRKMLDAQQRQENGEDMGHDIAKYNNIQMAKKIQLNSAYGAIGNQWFRYYDIRNAEAITLGGQLAIRWIEKALNKFMNETCKTDNYDYVIAIDTDSVYLRMDKIVSAIFPDKNTDKSKIVDFLDTICQKKIEPFIDNSYEDLADYMNAYEQKMQMGREGISDRGIWTAKKRYALNVYDMEGVRYAEPKMKVMGLEIVKSSTPAHVRGKLKEALNIILTGTQVELQELVADYKNEFVTLSASDIAFPRGISDYDKYITATKGIPIHVNAAQLYNKLLKKHGMNHVQPIGNGDKIKFIYLKYPNPYKKHVIGFPTGLPPEFEIERWIDYELQFEKSFLKPLEGILLPISWDWEEKSSLESFFA